MCFHLCGYNVNIMYPDYVKERYNYIAINTMADIIDYDSKKQLWCYAVFKRLQYIV